MYLDCDTTPPLRGRWTDHPDGFTQKRLDAAVRIATKMLADVTEGQIGIYESAAGAGFAGYVIKYPGEAAYFEAANHADAAP